MIKKLALALLVSLLTPILGAMEMDDAINNLESVDYQQRFEARKTIQSELSKASNPGADSTRLANLEKSLIDYIGKDPDPSVTRWVMRMLGQFGGADSIPVLTQLARSKDVGIRMQAIQSLAWLGDPKATPALTQLLKGSLDAADQVPLLLALGQRAEPSTIDTISNFLTNDSELAKAAAQALSQIKHPSATQALARARISRKGPERITIESALLTSDLDAPLLQELSTEGASSSIQIAAFQQWVQKDPQSAKKILESELDAIRAGKSSGVIFNAAMHSSLQDELVREITEKPTPVQIIILGAIADLGLRQFEETVLELSQSDQQEIASQAMETLGVIGTRTSYPQLFEATTKGNNQARDALIEIQDEEIDPRLFETARKGDSIDSRVAAIGLIGSRNPEGGREILHDLLEKEDTPEIRSAALKAVENIGNLESAKLLGKMILEGSGETRAVQGVLKKLTARANTPETYWSEVFLPLLTTNQKPEAKADLMAIMDAAACPAALEFLRKKVENPKDPLREAAFGSLLRWQDYKAAEVWLLALKARKPSDADLETIERGLIRLLNNQGGRVRQSTRNQTAIEAIPLLPNAESKLKILNVVAKDNKDKANLKKILPPLGDDLDVATRVKEILDSINEK